MTKLSAKASARPTWLLDALALSSFLGALCAVKRRGEEEKKLYISFIEFDFFLYRSRSRKSLMSIKVFVVALRSKSTISIVKYLDEEETCAEFFLALKFDSRALGLGVEDELKLRFEH